METIFIRVPGSTLSIELTNEEKLYRQQKFSDASAVLNEDIRCTACGKEDLKDSIISAKKKPYIHPALEVLVCKACFDFYEDGNFSSDEDGSDKYCRWCGNGGTLYLCSYCSVAICKRCVLRNFSPSMVNEIEQDEDWRCFVCVPERLHFHRAICDAAVRFVEEERARRKEHPKIKASGMTLVDRNLSSQTHQGSSSDSSENERKKKTPRRKVDDENSDMQLCNVTARKKRKKKEEIFSLDTGSRSYDEQGILESLNLERNETTTMKRHQLKDAKKILQLTVGSIVKLAVLTKVKSKILNKEINKENFLYSDVEPTLKNVRRFLKETINSYRKLEDNLSSSLNMAKKSSGDARPNELKDDDVSFNDNGEIVSPLITNVSDRCDLREVISPDREEDKNRRITNKIVKRLSRDYDSDRDDSTPIVSNLSGDNSGRDDSTLITSKAPGNCIYNDNSTLITSNISDRDDSTLITSKALENCIYSDNSTLITSNISDRDESALITSKMSENDSDSEVFNEPKTSEVSNDDSKRDSTQNISEISINKSDHCDSTKTLEVSGEEADIPDSESMISSKLENPDENEKIKNSISERETPISIEVIGTSDTESPSSEIKPEGQNTGEKNLLEIPADSKRKNSDDLKGKSKNSTSDDFNETVNDSDLSVTSEALFSPCKTPQKEVPSRNLEEEAKSAFLIDSDEEDELLLSPLSESEDIFKTAKTNKSVRKTRSSVKKEADKKNANKSLDGEDNEIAKLANLSTLRTSRKPSLLSSAKCEREMDEKGEKKFKESRNNNNKETNSSKSLVDLLHDDETSDSGASVASDMLQNCADSSKNRLDEADRIEDLVKDTYFNSTDSENETHEKEEKPKKRKAAINDSDGIVESGGDEDKVKNDSDEDSDDFSGKQMKKKRHYDKLLVGKLSDTDTSDEERRKTRYEKKMAREKSLKKIEISSDSEEIFVPNKSKRGGATPKKRRMSSSASEESYKASSDSESDYKTTSKKLRKKRKRIKNNLDSDSEDENEDESLANCSQTSKGRKNIRAVIADEDVEETTRRTLQEEERRKKRIQERQSIYNTVFTTPTKEAKKIDKLVLDFDPKSKEELVTVHPSLVSKLKPHQAEGVKFMWDACFESISQANESKGGGCILAHCMGLGKTLQVITLTHTLLTNECTGVKRVLVVCPQTTIYNWISEFQMWLNDLDDEIEIFDLVTKQMSKAVMSYTLENWYNVGGVMILGYERFRTLVNDKRMRKKAKESVARALLDPGPDLVVCDEGHKIKNTSSAISKAMNQIKTLRRIVLTGTPLQNNLVEYHCMVQFVKPHLLGTLQEFRNRFVNPIANGQYVDSRREDVKRMKRRAHVLHNMLDGVVQRFDYNVLTPFLPQKHEYVILLQMSDLQAQLYQYYLDNFSQKGAKAGSTLLVDYAAMSLIWTHPYVLKLSKDKKTQKEERAIKSDSEGSLKDFVVNTSGSDTESHSSADDVQILSDGGENVDGPPPGSPAPWWRQFVNDEDFEKMEHSAKFLLLMAILRECEKIGDKVLIFTQYITTLDAIEYFLEKEDSKPAPNDEDLPVYAGSWQCGYDYFRFDGSTPLDQRAAFCKNFNRENNSRARLFMMSTRAGGLGINLTAANRAIIFDASWNPSHDVQAIFRCFRFGQNKPCYIYRFLSQGTMEEKIYERQVSKLSMSCRVVDEQQIDRHFNSADINELYTFNRMTEQQQIPKVPKDLLMAELLKEFKNIIMSYHEHDSLLQNIEEEELNEEERKQAWEDFENEKRGRLNPYANNMPTLPPEIIWKMDPKLIAYMLTLLPNQQLVTNIRNEHKIRYPHMNEVELNRTTCINLSLSNAIPPAAQQYVLLQHQNFMLAGNATNMPGQPGTSKMNAEKPLQGENLPKLDASSYNFMRNDSNAVPGKKTDPNNVGVAGKGEISTAKPALIKNIGGKRNFDGVSITNESENAPAKFIKPQLKLGGDNFSKNNPPNNNNTNIKEEDDGIEIINVIKNSDKNKKIADPLTNYEPKKINISNKNANLARNSREDNSSKRQKIDDNVENIPLSDRIRYKFNQNIKQQSEENLKKSVENSSSVNAARNINKGAVGKVGISDEISEIEIFDLSECDHEEIVSACEDEEIDVPEIKNTRMRGSDPANGKVQSPSKRSIKNKVQTNYDASANDGGRCVTVENVGDIVEKRSATVKNISNAVDSISERSVTVENVDDAVANVSDAVANVGDAVANVSDAVDNSRKFDKNERDISGNESPTDSANSDVVVCESAIEVIDLGSDEVDDNETDNTPDNGKSPFGPILKRKKKKKKMKKELLENTEPKNELNFARDNSGSVELKKLTRYPRWKFPSYPKTNTSFYVNLNKNKSKLLTNFLNNQGHAVEIIKMNNNLIVEFALNAFGCKFLQMKLECATHQEKSKIFNAMMEHIYEFFQHPTGIYLVQKFFEVGIPLQKLNLASKMQGYVEALCRHKIGRYAVMYALQYLNPEGVRSLVEEIEDVFVSICYQNIAHIVAVECVKVLKIENLSYILDIICVRAQALCTSDYGAKVVLETLRRFDIPNIYQNLLDGVGRLMNYQGGVLVLEVMAKKGENASYFLKKIIDSIEENKCTESQWNLLVNVLANCENIDADVGNSLEKKIESFSYKTHVRFTVQIKKIQEKLKTLEPIRL